MPIQSHGETAAPVNQRVFSTCSLNSKIVSWEERRVRRTSDSQFETRRYAVLNENTSHDREEMVTYADKNFEVKQLWVRGFSNGALNYAARGQITSNNLLEVTTRLGSSASDVKTYFGLKGHPVAGDSLFDFFEIQRNSPALKGPASSTISWVQSKDRTIQPIELSFTRQSTAVAEKFSAKFLVNTLTIECPKGSLCNAGTIEGSENKYVCKTVSEAEVSKVLKIDTEDYIRFFGAPIKK